MKNFFKFLSISVLFSLVFSSCTNEDSILIAEESSIHTFEINASLASLNEQDETTRSSITSNVVVEWTKDAAISVINLSTMKILGGNLVAQTAGTKTTFTGTVTGSISAGDKLAFLYPAKNITAEQPLGEWDLVYDLFGNQTTSTPFVAKYTYTVPDNSKNLRLANADFSFLSAYLKMNLSTLPANAEVTNVTIENMGFSLRCTPNSDWSDLIADGFPGSININLSSTTKEQGYTVVKFSSAPIAKQTQNRNVTVTCGGDEYLSTMVNNEIKSNAYVNVNVSAFEKNINIPIEDMYFRSFLVKTYDTNGDREISIKEAEKITELRISGKSISSLKGIEYFKNLTFLECPINKLTSLDVSKNIKLLHLDCYGNQLTSLDVSKNIELLYLDCHGNKLTSLDVSKNTALTVLNCHANPLTSLDVSKNTALTFLACDNNQLTTLDISKNTKLTSLYCRNNQLTSLDVSKHTALRDLWCNNNQLTTLDISKNTELTILYCQNNPLTYIYISRLQLFDSFNVPSDAVIVTL